MAIIGWFPCFFSVLLAQCLPLHLIISVWWEVLEAGGFCSDALILINILS